jgi:hypothetical protein
MNMIMIVDGAKQGAIEGASGRADGRSADATVNALGETTRNPSRNKRMATIIAGMFDTVAKANPAVEDLYREQFDCEDVGVFHINAPGQRDTSPIDSDLDERPAGVMVAVNTGDGARQQTAIDVLRARGAHTIERAEGTWRDGDWVDFDPARRPSYVEKRIAARGSSEVPFAEGNHRVAGRSDTHLRRILEVTRGYFDLAKRSPSLQSLSKDQAL